MIETALRAGLTTKQDDEFALMAQLVLDAPPQNAKDLFDLVSKHITNGKAFNKGMKQRCSSIVLELKKQTAAATPKPTPSVAEQSTPSTLHESEADGTPAWGQEKDTSDEESKTDPAYTGAEAKFRDRKRQQMAERETAE